MAETEANHHRHISMESLSQLEHAPPNGSGNGTAELDNNAPRNVVNGAGVGVGGGGVDGLGDLSGLLPQRKTKTSPIAIDTSQSRPQQQSSPDTSQPDSRTTSATSNAPGSPTFSHASSPSSAATAHDMFNRRSSHAKSYSDAQIFRPSLPTRNKTVPTGFSTVTPSRPAFSTAKPRRPSSSGTGGMGGSGSSVHHRSFSELVGAPGPGSAPASGGRSPQMLRKQSVNVYADNGADGSGDFAPVSGTGTGRIRRPSLQSFDSTPSTPTLGGEGHDDESFFVLDKLEEDKEAEAVTSGVSNANSPVGSTEVKEETKKGWGFSPASYLQASFQAVRESMLGDGAGQGQGQGQGAGGAVTQGPKTEEAAAVAAAVETDWEFWGKLMNDYENTVRRHPRTFTRKLHLGIPDSLRGMVWQLICKGKDPDLENQYATLLTRTSIHEKVIQRDLARTFPKHERFVEVGGPGQESLFNIIKAYSLFDTEIGYCQGIAFVVGAILLNMPDEESFCVLVRLMRTYNLRDLYTPKMIGLQLRLYQFDELLIEHLPPVFRHLETHEVKSNMYASQWFMTMFAYRFPLACVFRIMDVMFAEGVDAMLKFALALVKKNSDKILALTEFEQLLEFLKNGLFDAYADNIDQFVADAVAIKISKTRLDKLAADHAEAVRLAGPEHMELEALRAEARRMNETIRRMEMEYEILNREHVTLANRLLDQTVRADNLQTLATTLQARVAVLETREADVAALAEERVHGEMQRLAQKNLELTSRNVELEEQVDGLMGGVREAKEGWAECENERAELERRWEGLRRVVGGG
ncbi:rab-GTPase-TBC domain-containing protein [Fimicolochytrium jonesii]|uniref:rab-GTPase-TBC domain-containing protein n=1 Tax=Fimicolochytrium jonesii TaxID=1396493 RepID=UPI0022FF1263|nr:rab-GTPase-TBC domain-containing protein [Fimicolochytrium jonesii]KAI8817678.1 rab-GTPase-TBC domain-containing protein [Fimicolochytrium jonesii]